MEKILHFIDGQFVESQSGRTFDNVNPATGEVISQVAEGGREEINRAVLAARNAFRSWGKTPAQERAAVLNRMAELIEQRVDELARLETLDTGKPLSLSKTLDIPRAAANFRFFADFVKGLGTECFEMDGVALNYALRRPVGVAGLISPWNLPLLLLTWKVAPCLAAGNTCVIKPAELTPTTAAKLAEIAKEAGLPDGVLNVVHGFGPDAAGSFLTEHPDVNLISLTGETTTGKAVMRAAAGSLKRLSFELGGKNPNIIFADADLEDALTVSLRSSFSNQGEVCLCGSRIYVE
ncbi:MAG: aldehyde dehydrogenase family protein, partial [Alicyclobacillus shizuokensis]|nr:aldehyde dehydrogenase family protein [Alicyclobacillus shizuokensis]